MDTLLIYIQNMGLALKECVLQHGITIVFPMVFYSSQTLSCPKDFQSQQSFGTSPLTEQKD